MYINNLVFVFIVASFSIINASNKNAIGNHLMKYFHLLLQSSMKGQKLDQNTLLKYQSNKEILSFYKKLPLILDLTEEDKNVLQSFPKEIWSINWPWSSAEWGKMADPYYLIYQDILSGICKKVIRKALIESGFSKEVKQPVIHYRLGDVPFVRNYGHHLNKDSFYFWALEKIMFEDNNNKTVRVVSANFHSANLQKKEVSCLYLNAFINFLNKNGYEVVCETGSIMEDFAIMVFAPVLIGASSSFSFMAGLANEKMFLSPLIGSEIRGKYHANSCCEWMYQEPPLLHCEVRNYFDIKEVLPLLYE